MNEKELTSDKSSEIELISTQNKVASLEKNILSAIEEYSKRGELDKIEALSNLYLKVQENVQQLDINKSKNDELLLLNKQDRKIGYVKQVISIILSISLVPLGIYVFLQVDKNTGIFIMGAGFSSAGLSGFLNSDFVKSIFQKK